MQTAGRTSTRFTLFALAEWAAAFMCCCIPRTGDDVEDLAPDTRLCAPRVFEVGGLPNDITTADMDGDGDIDMVVGNSPIVFDLGEEGNVAILSSDGHRDFSEHVNYATEFSVASVATGDFDGNDSIDVLAASNAIGDTVASFLPTDSDSAFTGDESLGLGSAASPSFLFAADLDLDGDVDFISANSYSNNISVLLNNGMGAFGPGTNYVVGSGAFEVPTTRKQNTTIGDFDGDGDPDLVTRNNLANAISLLRNDGSGTFSDLTKSSVDGCPRFLDAGDLDTDGDLDIVASDSCNDDIMILFNDGLGNFTLVERVASVIVPRLVTIADMNGDQDLDLIITQFQDESLYLFQGRGDGTFGPPLRFPAGGDPVVVVAQDLDGDGRIDLVVANALKTMISVLFNATP